MNSCHARLRSQFRLRLVGINQYLQMRSIGGYWLGFPVLGDGSDRPSYETKNRITGLAHLSLFRDAVDIVEGAFAHFTLKSLLN